MSEVRRLLLGAGLPDAGAAVAAARRVAVRADEQNLVDVAYAFVDSPYGRLLVAATRRGLVRVALRESLAGVLQELADRVSPRVLESPARLDRTRRELDEYFEGRRRRFEMPLDWALTTGFSERVLRATARIPFGRVATYRDVARVAGNAAASRAAGNALHGNPIPIVVPCHRVVRTGGDLGGYGGGLRMKQSLLRLEGAELPGSR